MNLNYEIINYSFITNVYFIAKQQQQQQQQ